MPITNCVAGAPIILSCPHFWNGHDSLINSVDGIAPIKDAHETYLNIDPLSGVTLDGHKRIQVNLGLLPIPSLSVLANVNRTTFPIVWFDEYGTLSEELQTEYEDTITRPLNTVDGVSIAVGMVFGLSLIHI